MVSGEKMSSKTDSKIGSLEEEAFKRKERLRQLKRKATETTDQNDTNSEQKPTFRSYKPQNDAVAEKSIVTEVTPVDIEAEVQVQLDLLKTPMVIDEIDIANLAPRKPDWDLKRDVSKKLDKLEKRTQRAIAELIRERLKTNHDNMLQAVNIGSAISQSQSNET